MMARPKSTNPRNLTTTMRLTAPESTYLTTMFGSPGKGLRHLLNQEMRRARDSEVLTRDGKVVKGPRRDGMDHQEPPEGFVRLAPAAHRPEEASMAPPEGTVKTPKEPSRDGVAHEARQQVVVEPRQSGKTKKALEAVEAAKAKGLNVTVAGPVPASGLKGLPDTPTPNPPAKKPASSSDAAKRHLHKPGGDPIRTFAEKGVQWKVYLCACGEELKR